MKKLGSLALTTPTSPSPIQLSDTGIVDSGASNLYFAKNAPYLDAKPNAPQVQVGTATGNVESSAGTGKLAIPNLPHDFPRTGHVMPSFAHTLIGLGPICDADCSAHFTKHQIVIYDPHGAPLITGWREPSGARLWRIALCPDDDDVPGFVEPAQTASLAAFSAYDLPSVRALVIYLHAAAGFPVRDTWLSAIKAGNYDSWPGLTYNNAARYCPSADETLKGHFVQQRQGLRSTKKEKSDPGAPQDSPTSEPTSRPENAPQDSPTSEPSSKPTAMANELHIKVEHISKLYTDDTGRFPTRARSGNQYIMVAYHCDSNAILVAPFKSRKDLHRQAAYNSIRTRLAAKGLTVDLQVLDNEASSSYKLLITSKWGTKFQLVPPDVHRSNAAERAIRTFKAHFLAILAGISSDFPKNLWDLLLPQAELTLNLLRQSRLNPKISAWEYFAGPFNYDATPVGPLGSRVIIHKKPGVRNAWDFRGEEGWSAGVSLEHYRCQKIVRKSTKALAVSDTIAFRHQSLTQPSITPADRLLHGVHTLASALRNTPATVCEAQLQAIGALRDAFQGWASQQSAAAKLPDGPQAHPRIRAPARKVFAPKQVPPPRPPHHTSIPAPVPRVGSTTPTAPPPRVAPPAPPLQQPSPPRVPTPEPVASRTRSRQQVPPRRRPHDQPIAHRTRARQALVSPVRAASRKYPLAFLAEWALPVLDKETGHTLEHRQLRRHPKYKHIWDTSYANELGRLCQGVGKGDQGTKKQRVAGTDTFRAIQFDDIPKDRRDQITYTKVVCEVRPEKDDPNRTRITIGGNRIIYPGDVGTPTGSLELLKLVINSVLSRPGAKFACFDVKNFYLETPMERSEFVKIKIEDIPQEFIDEYDLLQFAHNGWVYFEIVRGCYGLPQSGKLANDLLRTRLNKAGYYEAATTPGLWRHKWRPILFILIVDDFGIEYVGKAHAEHLRAVLTEHYKISEDWEGKKFAGINLAWTYAAKHVNRQCRLSMNDYIADLLLKYGHKTPSKPQLSPHPHRAINYGAKQQLAAEEDTSAKLNIAGIRRIEGIVGALLYYGRAVNNKLLVALSTLGSQQASATEQTNTNTNQLLDYVATYPDDGIVYRSSSMILAGHSDAGFNNETKGRSRAGAHIFLSENDPSPRWNGAVLTIAQIIKFVLSSAAESELGALFITAKEMIPLRHTLTEMGWKQPPSPLQTDNSAAEGVCNKTIVPRKLKSMDLRYHWLRSREAQQQFRYYWAPGQDNWADYSTKHHPPIYHESKRPRFAA